MRNVLLILSFILLSSCGQANKKALQEYDGTYKTNNDTNCPMVVVISSQSDGYHYRIKTSTTEQEGLLAITKTDQEVYLTFSGLLGAEPKNEIEGQYINKSIVIQNDGNSMNQYLNFSECNLKFIEFLKVETK